MDAKITKKRLNELLSYDWIKIIALAVAGVILWSLIFTMTAVRLSVGQQFKIFMYYDVTTGDKFNDFTEDLTDNVLSFDILNFSYEQLLSDSYSTILSARFAVNEGDLMITTNTNTDEEAQDSNFKSFVDSYNIAYPIDELIADAEAYYNMFYDGEGNFNMLFLKSHFKERMDGDNRYKTDEQYEKAYIQEMDRIDALKTSVISLKEYISLKPECLVKYKIYEQYNYNNTDSEYTIGEEKTYGIDISNVTGITNIIKDSSGGNENLTLAAINWKNKQPDLQYEVIPVIVKLLEGTAV